MRIAVFGDSISHGGWDKEKGGWVNRLKIFAMRELGHTGVYNSSSSGGSTEDVLRRFDADCVAIKPDIIIFAIGLNDSRYTTTTKDNYVPRTKFKKNIGKLISSAKKYTSKIIFLEANRVDEPKVTPLPWHTTEYYLNKNTKEYNEIIKQLCKKNKIDFIPLFNKISDNLLYDGAHPNAKGHELIFKTVKDFLIKNKLI